MGVRAAAGVGMAMALDHDEASESYGTESSGHQTHARPHAQFSKAARKVDHAASTRAPIPPVATNRWHHIVILPPIGLPRRSGEHFACVIVMGFRSAYP